MRFVTVLATITVMGFGAPAIAGEEFRYSRVSAALFDGPEGKVLGNIPPGTPVTVKKTMKKRAHVVIEGWSQQYHELEVFSDHEHRIHRASLARVKDDLRKVGKEHIDEWGTKWFQVRLEGWVDAASLTEKSETVWQDARSLYESRCYDCHETRIPEMLTPAQWRGTLIIMAHRAALTPEESTLLRQYFQTFAKKE